MENILRKDETINNMIIFAIIWSFGGCLNQAQRKKFEIYMKGIYLEYKVPINYQYSFGPYNKFTLNALAST
jgi:hypothetical protein